MMLSYCMTSTGGCYWVMWRQISLEQKDSFLSKLEDGFGSSFLLLLFLNCFLPALLQRSPRILLELTKDENMIYADIMYYTSKSVLWKTVFYGVEIKNQWIILGRSIGSGFSCFYHHCPTPTFPFLLGLSLGILMLWNEFSSVLKHSCFMWVDVMQE